MPDLSPLDRSTIDRIVDRLLHCRSILWYVGLETR
jgi:hypothetical protein